MCSFPNSNVRAIYSNKTLYFGTNNDVRAVDSSGRMKFTGKPVSFTVGQLQIAGTAVRPTLFVRKTADETLTASSALQDDDELFITLGTAATSTTSSPKQSVLGTGSVSLGGVGIGTKLGMAATGIIRAGATTGPLRVRWAQNTAAALATTVYQDSFLQLTRMS